MKQRISMPIRKALTVFMMIAMVSSLTGCNFDKSILNKIVNFGEDEPVALARSFWNAALSENPDSARQYMAKSSQLIPMPKSPSPDDFVQLGEAVSQGGAFYVETFLTLHREATFQIPMQTVLVYENNTWKVDYYSSLQTPFGAVLDQSIRHLVNTMNASSQYLNTVKFDKEGQAQEVEHMDKQLKEMFDSSRAKIIEGMKKSFKPEKNKADITNLSGKQ